MIAFVQPFGLRSPGGGARILRAMLRDAPCPWISVCTAPSAPPLDIGAEIVAAIRPALGPLERSRLRPLTYALEKVLRPRFQRKLKGVFVEKGVSAVHGLAHGMDFLHAFEVAKQLALPYYLSVHDDLAYALAGARERREGLAALGPVWTAARARFVISDAMGREYCRRYGEQPYLQVTDGLDCVPTAPLKRDGKSLRIYFMGLFHLGYGPNLKALLAALRQLQINAGSPSHIAVKLRCGTIPPDIDSHGIDLKVLPFGTERDVIEDMQTADLLYLPLPFAARHEGLVRYSLSTKMITYLGSGLPILYHGPRQAAAGQLLEENNAAFITDSLEPGQIGETLGQLRSRAAAIVNAALDLANRQFLLSEQRRRFWESMAVNSAGISC